MEILHTGDTLSPIYLDAVKIRHEVFVKEQGVPLTAEIDQDEANCVHFVAYEEKTPLGTCRLLPEKNGMHLQRMAVLKPYRNQHLGKEILLEVERFSKEQHWKKITLHAQISAIPFYEKLGFQTLGEPFLEAGIDHKLMEKNL